jgi:hypothetical protein
MSWVCPLYSGLALCRFPEIDPLPGGEEIVRLGDVIAIWYDRDACLVPRLNRAAVPPVWRRPKVIARPGGPAMTGIGAVKPDRMHQPPAGTCR